MTEGKNNNIRGKVLPDILALHASNQQLSQQVTVLTQQISAWLSLQSNASAQPAQPTPPSPQQVEQGPGPREPAISDPEHFAGQSELCRGFLFQCSTVFNQRPSSFSSDISRIQYMCGLMRGRALKWAEARFSNTAMHEVRYRDFVKEIKQVFDHPDYRSDASAKLMSLSQGQRSVSDYSIDFWTLKAEVDWTEQALRAAFTKGLSDQIKDELMSRDEPDDLESLISLANKIDNRIRARRKERDNSARSSTRTTALSPPIRPSRQPIRFEVDQIDGPEPMQLGRAHLTPEELQRRRQAGEYLYCGKSGHFLASCPTRPKDRSHSVSVGVQMSQPVPTVKTPVRFQIQASLCVNTLSIPLLALIDSGAEDNFLDQQVALQAGIELETLSAPVSTLALDGRLLARVTHKTAPVNLVLSGNHREQIQFYILSAPTTPLILGHPWLVQHNPTIDWKEGRVTSWGNLCHSNCLLSALPPLEGFTVAGDAENGPDLTNIPEVYHDLQEVFSKSKAVSLPPHRPYDCAIDLIPGAQLPSSRLYNVSKPEREAMEKYIAESLAAGLIRPSKSPLGAGFFFVPKKDRSLRPCIDFRGLNNITIKNKYPLPLLDSAFTPLQGATVFTKLDLRNAYHLVRIKEGHEWKTAFKTPMGHFEYQVISRDFWALPIFIADLLRTSVVSPGPLKLTQPLIVSRTCLRLHQC
uniref:Retrotransposon gag domain-containing protein n=1 Tax=Gouania willdenowi TaxID=441366 RepID=A0A8C5DKJ9_GOUWI